MRARSIVPACLVLAVLAGPATAQVRPPNRPPEVTDSAIAWGKALFHGSANCAACHGQGARGSDYGPPLTGVLWLRGSGTYEWLIEQVKHGVPADKSFTGEAMPMRGWTPMNDEEVKAVAAYVWSVSHPAQPPRPRLVEPEAGERHLRNLHQLTFGGNNAEAYFSPSGQELIFQRQEHLASGCDQQYVMNVDGSGLRRVSNGLGRTTCGYFYDGGRRILYSSTFEHSPDCPPRPDRSQGYVWPLASFEIYSARADGSDLGRLTRNDAYDAEATVSPDGKRVVFTSTRDHDIELYTMSPDGSDVRRLTRRVGYDGGAFFSPDGKRIVWRAMYPETPADTADYLRLLERRLVRPSRLEIWVANADGSEARQVTRLSGANFAPFFHPDGKRVIFASNQPDPRSRNFDLYLVNLDGTGLEQVTTSTEFDGFPMFSPDGKRLVFASNRHAAQQGETNIFVAEWVE